MYDVFMFIALCAGLGLILAGLMSGNKPPRPSGRYYAMKDLLAKAEAEESELEERRRLN